MTDKTEQSPNLQDDTRTVLQDVLFDHVQTMLALCKTESFALQIPETETHILIGPRARIVEVLGLGGAPFKQMPDSELQQVLLAAAIHPNEPYVRAAARAMEAELARRCCAQREDNSATHLARQSQAAQPTGDDQWIFDLAAKHESRNGTLYGPVTFSSTALPDFVRDVAAHLTGQSQATMQAVPDAWMVGLHVFKTWEQAHANIRNPELRPVPLYATPVAKEAPAVPSAWMRANRKECTTAESKAWMENAGFGHWPEIANEYTIPLYEGASPQAPATQEAARQAVPETVIAKWMSLRGNVVTCAINGTAVYFPPEDANELLDVFDAALPSKSDDEDAEDATQEAAPFPFKVVLDPNMPPNMFRMESGRHSVTAVNVGSGWQEATQEAEIGSVQAAVYTCKGKGGQYELIGHSNGAGAKRGETIVVYRDMKEGDILYHRSTSDFNERMEQVAPTTSTVSAPIVQALAKRLESMGVTNFSFTPGPNATPETVAAEISKALDQLATPSSTEGTQEAPEEVRESAVSEVTYNPNHLLDVLLNKMQLKNDAALARMLEVAPVIIAKIRRNRQSVGVSLLIRMHEVTGISVRDLRDLMGDRRTKYRLNEPVWTEAYRSKRNPGGAA